MPNWKLSKHKIIFKFLFYSNIILVISTLAAYASPYFDAAQYPYFAVFGLVYSVLLICNIAMVILWFLVKPKMALLSILVILLGINNIQHVFGFNFMGQNHDENAIEIGSFNLQFFKSIATAQSKDKAILTLSLNNFVKANSDTEILCFQEYGKFTNELLDSLLPHPYVHRVENMTTAIYSKFPIIESGVVDFDSNIANTCIWVDILINDKPLRVYNFHLESNRHDGQVPEEIVEDAPEEFNFKILLGIVLYYNKFTIQRTQQAHLIRTHTSQCKHPIVLCGDMNDSPFSFTYAKMSENLNDAFLKKGKGLASTHDNIKTGLRIDYILVDQALKVSDFQIYKEDFSDHHFLKSSLEF